MYSLFTNRFFFGVVYGRCSIYLLTMRNITTHSNVHKMFMFFSENAQHTVTKIEINIAAKERGKKLNRKSHKNKMKQHPNKYKKVSSCDSVYDFEDRTIHETLFHFYIIYEKIKSIKMNKRQPNSDHFDDLRNNREFVLSCSRVFFSEFLVTVHWCIVYAHWLPFLWFWTTAHVDLDAGSACCASHRANYILAQKGAAKGIRRRKHWY